MASGWIERVLLVAGAQDTGKSTQLRSMFQDPRFGTGCQIPTSRNVPETYALSPHRSLYLRLTSPHEWGETLTEFLDKMEVKSADGRWVVASAVQVDAGNKMPALVDVVPALDKRFSPERIRVALLSPDRHGTTLTGAQAIVDTLWKIPGCEVLFIDSRTRDRNGLLLADTFDFS